MDVVIEYLLHAEHLRHARARIVVRRRFGKTPQGAMVATMNLGYAAAMKQVVSHHPEVLGGERVFVGTRVPVRSLFDHLEAGESIDQFLEGFPSVRREQVVALLRDARAHSLAAS